MLIVRFLTLPMRVSEGAVLGETVVVVVVEAAACTSATPSDLAILRGAFVELEGEGIDLRDAVAAFHCDRAEGGPGSLEEGLMGGLAEVDAILGTPLTEALVGLPRMIGPKSLNELASLMEAKAASSMGRLPSDEEARVVSGL